MMFLAGTLFGLGLWALSRTDWRQTREADFPLFDEARVDIDLERWEALDDPVADVIPFPDRHSTRVPA